MLSLLHCLFADCPGWEGKCCSCLCNLETLGLPDLKQDIEVFVNEVAQELVVNVLVETTALVSMDGVAQVISGD